MLIVDVIVVVALVVALFSGYRRGFVASLGTIIGLVAGAFAALWLVPLIAPWIPASAWRGALTAGAAIAIVLICASIGAAIGRAVRRGVDRARLSVVDRVLGAGIGTVATGLVLLMVGQAVVVTGTPVISSAVGSSRVLGWIDDVTPPSVDTALAQVRGLVIDEGLPALGELLDVQTVVTSPPVDLADPDLEAAGASVARISGTAYACGVSMTGSGFVAADDLVVTNAHVVAGIDDPLVELPGRTALPGRVVYFDPTDDLALVAVDGLDARVLPLTDALAPGDTAAVQGYPLGGPFTSVTAAVVSRGEVPVPNIYDTAVAARDIYALDAVVQPGNSGGPLLTADGEVGGVVFARGADGSDRGYAMTIAELTPALSAADADSAAVSTGDCTE